MCVAEGCNLHPGARAGAPLPSLALRGIWRKPGWVASRGPGLRATAVRPGRVLSTCGSMVHQLTEVSRMTWSKPEFEIVELGMEVGAYAGNA